MISHGFVRQSKLALICIYFFFLPSLLVSSALAFDFSGQYCSGIFARAAGLGVWGAGSSHLRLGSCLGSVVRSLLFLGLDSVTPSGGLLSQFARSLPLSLLANAVGSL